MLSVSRRRFSFFGVRRRGTPSAVPSQDPKSPGIARKALVKSAAQSIRWPPIPRAMALTVPAINRLFGERGNVDAPPAELLEFESPTAALVEAPLKPAARSMLWTAVSAIIASMAVSALFPIDMVVTGSGRVVSLQATNVVQPLETAIVRAINVREGQTVRAGEPLARLDPTFSAADATALQTQVKSFQAEVDRLTAEASGTPYQPSSADNSTVLQVAMYGQRQAQYRYQIESYNQKISGLQAQITRAEHDVEAFSQRYRIASVLESKRRELERLQVGSQVNRLIAEDQAIEMQRNLTDATGAAERAHRDLDQLVAERDGFEQQWKAKISEELTLRRRNLSDATESLRKATLRRELVDLRADQDAIVLSVAKVSVGSVLQSGEPLITLVPSDAPLEVEMRIATADAGYVHAGQKVAIKFDTFPFVQYGLAEGTVRFVSPDSFSGGQDTQRGTVVTQSDSAAVFYKARVAIDQLKMHGVPGGFQLKPGMTVTADIKAGTRTLLTYLFARVLPIGLEGMREP
ncbi:MULTISPECIES: HlyD family type I secretion periplasmic adaptor subunit [Bradyrhizobium]|uniref:HlyD family type I secretion periplasmic adaptor subunit n=1 Tax=Bradyrhizobium pachyrhizi TaxID=280333 RepID=UPI002AA5D87A